jgi:Domain of unknown function (DUF4145)
VTMIKCLHCDVPFEANEETKSTLSNEVELNLAGLNSTSPEKRRYLLFTEVLNCTNLECGRSSLAFSVRTGFQEPRGRPRSGEIQIQRLVKRWQLFPPPQPAIRQWPQTVPKEVVSDHREARLIVSLSPKAAATMARRCLQVLIRMRYGVSFEKLNNEIQAVRSKVDEQTWEALQGLRVLGNLGAHPEHNPSDMIELDQSQAETLIKLGRGLISA